MLTTNKNFVLQAVICVTAILHLWISEPSYYDFQPLYICSCVGLYLFREFIKFKSQPEIKRPKIMVGIVSCVIAAWVISIMDAGYYAAFSIAHHGEHDEVIVTAKQDFWDLYMVFYVLLWGLLTISIFFGICAYVTTKRK